MIVRVLLVLAALLMATDAFAQTAPPADGDKPPAAPAKPRAPPAPVPSSKSIAERLQACLKVDDGTKYRLDCYDAVVAPKPKPSPATAKGVLECRFLKEEDERLACFNGFTEQIPKFTH